MFDPHVCIVCKQYTQRSEKTEDPCNWTYISSVWVIGPNQGLLQDQKVFLATGSSLTPKVRILNSNTNNFTLSPIYISEKSPSDFLSYHDHFLDNPFQEEDSFRI